LRLRVSAVFLPHFRSSENGKYSAAVASTSWLTDAAYPLRVHTVFLHFRNFELEQKSWLRLLAELCGVALSVCGQWPQTLRFTLMPVSAGSALRGAPEK